MDDDAIKRIFEDTRTIAVVGLSSDPAKAGQYVPAYLQKKRYRVIPVNPSIAEALGEKSYPDLVSVPEKVDLVLIFRRPEHALSIVEDAGKIGAKTVWMQDGAGDKEAAARAEELGMTTVVNDCMLRQFHRLYE